MTITVVGRVSMNSSFQKFFVLPFVQIPSPYAGSHMQIYSESIAACTKSLWKIMIFFSMRILSQDVLGQTMTNIVVKRYIC